LTKESYEFCDDDDGDGDDGDDGDDDAQQLLTYLNKNVSTGADR